MYSKSDVLLERIKRAVFVTTPDLGWPTPDHPACVHVAETVAHVVDIDATWNEAIEATAKMADDMDDDGTYGSCIRTLKRGAATGEGCKVDDL